MQEPPTPTLLRPPTQGHEAPSPNGGEGAPPRPRLKKLRLAFILLGLSLLAVVSTVFGMMMAVASDLPSLENESEYRAAKNSVLVADNEHGTEIAKLTGNQNRILLSGSEISPHIKNAIVAVEDRRFYQHEGVDYKGIARALWQDLRRKKAAEGGSTITQQFVKNALSAQGNRSVFQKVREAALAYHLEREWSKSKILTQYLNTVYFGNGAYGVESAARTYFNKNQTGEGRPAASEMTPAQAALLAGIVSSPNAYDPIENPKRARHRRNLVLARMLNQRMVTLDEYENAVDDAIPTDDQIDPPRPDSKLPYFSTWLTQQLVDRYGPGLVFGGGLRIRTTIDPELQAAAEEAISGRLAGVGPDASLVAIDNETGEVKAMVGGENFDEKPFNLATNGHRQPGSAFKPFTLIAALEDGVSPDATFASKKKVLPVPGKRDENFVVNNYEDHYAGLASLRSATASSDNSVYGELGLRVGTDKIARVAQRMGIRTSVSTNAAMTLGGLKQGLTPLELAHAYTTIANKGKRVSGTLAASKGGPVAIERIKAPGREARNQKRTEEVFPEAVGETAQQLLAGVIQGGTGKAAQIREFAAGKTGTTENYGDAWFVGFNKELTVAVWVGYADKLKSMETEYRGGPVAGGTYPAEIWRDFMTAWLRVRETRDAARGEDDQEKPPLVPTIPATPTTPEGQETQPTGPDNQDEPGQDKGGQRAPQQDPPQERQPDQGGPAPAPSPRPQPGGDSGGAVGAPGQ